MPNRILKESICVSESLEPLTWFEEVLFYRLIVSCDDYGRYDGRPVIIKNRLFPLKNGIPLEEVEGALVTLDEKGLICLYEVDGKPYLYLRTWGEHQVIRAKRSKYPDPASNCKQMHANVSVIQSNTETKSNSETGARIQSETKTETKPETKSETKPEAKSETKPEPKPEAKPNPPVFVPPTEREVEKYCEEIHSPIRADRFYCYYRSRGWKGIQDWRAALQLWIRRETDKSPGTPDLNEELRKLTILNERMKSG